MLVEIMVSLSIFTLIAVSTTGALLAIMDANTKAQSLRAVMDNLNVAIENMSRTIRIGTDYRCSNGLNDANESRQNNVCVNGKDTISFLPQDAEIINGEVDTTDRVYYYFKSDENDSDKGSIYRWRRNVETALTAPEINVTKVTFYLSGADLEDGQPRVLMTVNGKAGDTVQSETSFLIQTSVTQRSPDCDDPNSCSKN